MAAFLLYLLVSVPIVVQSRELVFPSDHTSETTEDTEYLLNANFTIAPKLFCHQRSVKLGFGLYDKFFCLLCSGFGHQCRDNKSTTTSAPPNMTTTDAMKPDVSTNPPSPTSKPSEVVTMNVTNGLNDPSKPDGPLNGTSEGPTTE